MNLRIDWLNRLRAQRTYEFTVEVAKALVTEGREIPQ
jgi:hypothetical protein